MSEVMTCMPFEQLMNWVLEEKKTKGTVFGQHRAYAAETDRKLNIFERNLETPIGPAAGPHTQLTQNIVASYYAGARFFTILYRLTINIICKFFCSLTAVCHNFCLAKINVNKI